MTREEAIKTLRELWRETNDTWYEEVYNMAIEALSADTVSREEYEEVKAYMDTLVDAFIEDGEELAELVKVVRCKDCRQCVEHYDTDGCPYWICNEWEGGTDADGFCHYGERKGGEDE